MTFVLLLGFDIIVVGLVQSSFLCPLRGLLLQCISIELLARVRVPELGLVMAGGGSWLVCG